MRWTLGIAVICGALARVWAADLPGEGTLPGQRPTPPAKALPSEATLPPGSISPSRSVATADPQATPSQPATPRQSTPPQQPSVQTKPVLPPESQLPADFVVQAPQSVTDFLLDLEPGSESIPAAASQSDGPTAPPAQNPDPKQQGSDPSNKAAAAGQGAQEPGGADQAAAQPPIGQAPPGLPWLRLNMQGHVGIVRALTFTADGSRLCSAGDDKAVEVWARLGARNPGAADAGRWVHERAIRWPVERGPRGRIYALAAAPKLLAIAGYGILGGLGQIWLVDPATGELKRALIDEEIGHQQVVAGLAFPPGRSDVLASQDITGRLLVWRQNPETGLWKATRLTQSDAETRDAEEVRIVQPYRRFAPVVMPTAELVVAPVLLPRDRWKVYRTRPEGVPAWSLAAYDVATGKATPFAGTVQQEASVIALAATNDGQRLVSSDQANLFFWNLESKSLAKQVPNVAIKSLAWSQDGQTLVAGSLLSPAREGKAVVQRWQVPSLEQPQMVAQETVDRDVNAVALTPDGREWAYDQGADVVLQRQHDGDLRTDRLWGLTRPVLRVAFAAQGPEYRLAIGTRRNAEGQVPLEKAFDLGAVKLEAAGEWREEDWLNPNRARGEWSLASTRDRTGEVQVLHYSGKPAIRLPLHPTLHGRPSAVCWIGDAAGEPFAVAIGTSLQGNIFVFRLVRPETETQDPAQVLRQFRGHEGGVRALSVSRDGKYLASGADDGTVRVWNLDGYATVEPAVNRWGARFEVRDGKLIAAEVREDSRLHFLGVRSEDQVRTLAWPENGQTRIADTAEEMLRLLQTCHADTQVVFDFRRRDTQLPGFQLIPAWQPLAALYLAENREWAYWTPAGYYDASFDGHKLFGWQVNRSVDLLPEFFLAAQFRQALERPEVMRKLLAAGNLPAALRESARNVPDGGQDAVIPQYRLKPRVEILSPEPASLVTGGRTRVQARITVREGLELIPPKAFANGVVAATRRLLEVKDVPGGQEHLYEWDASLPADRRVVIQVVASTDAEVVESQTVQVRQETTGRPGSRRVYVLAAGVNRYRDAQIQRLDFAANNARRVTEVLTAGAVSPAATTLIDDLATRPMWKLITTDYAARLREEVGPDDLLVFFLSGHGVRDEQTGQYYFVAADARFDDLKSQRFADCLSFDDFTAFAEIPCRKLVVLDTCHSGAVQQPLRQQDLKAALRALQDDVVFTMTASEGSQEAAEDQSRQLGRFTARLVEALTGAADQTTHGGDADGLITLREASSYVRATVAADSARDPQQQFPTAGPIDLLDFAELPLAVARGDAGAGSP